MSSPSCYKPAPEACKEGSVTLGRGAPNRKREIQETGEQSVPVMRARGSNGYRDLKSWSIFSAQLAKHLIVLFSDRDSLTQKGKQHGQHKHYHGYTLRTIDRCNRAGSFQVDAGKSSEVTRLHPQSDGHLCE